jgi:predicted kinase
MVLNVAKMMKYEGEILVSSLLHDLGKPATCEANHEKKRNSFFNHEGVSFWKAIEIVKKLTDIHSERELILKLISLHSVIFDNMKEKKVNKSLMLKFRKDPLFLADIKKQVISDVMGRFCHDTEDVRDTFEIIFDNEFYEEFKLVCDEEDKFSKTNTLTILIGIPRSGKSTWIKNNVTTEVVISRDDILMQFASKKYGTTTYSDCFKAVSSDDQLEIDSLLNQKFQGSVRENKDIVVDMTNMSRKSRRRWGASFKGKRKAIVFATEFSEIVRRNEQDKIEIGKYIPEHVLFSMSKNFVYPQYDEFDEIEMIVW